MLGMVYWNHKTLLYGYASQWCLSDSTVIKKMLLCSDYFIKSQNFPNYFLLLEPFAIHSLCIFNEVTMIKDKIPKFSGMMLLFFAGTWIGDLGNGQYNVKVSKSDCIKIGWMTVGNRFKYTTPLPLSHISNLHSLAAKEIFVRSKFDWKRR